MAGRKPPNSGFHRCATETQTISMPERAREPHTHQVMAPTETTAMMQGGHFKSEPRISLHNLPSGNCKFGLWAQILPRKLAFTCFYRKKLRFHSRQEKPHYRLHLPSWSHLPDMNWILKCKFFPGAWGWQLDVATLLKTIWKQFCYYYYHHHHDHYFNLAIRLIWLGQHFQQIVMAWRRDRKCVGGVGEGGGCSCHDHFYSVLGVKYLTTTMCYRLKPDAWEGAREKEGLLTIVLINIKVINMTAFLINYM